MSSYCIAILSKKIAMVARNGLLLTWSQILLLIKHIFPGVAQQTRLISGLIKDQLKEPITPKVGEIEGFIWVFRKGMISALRTASISEPIIIHLNRKMEGFVF
jgi:hypothetical protein